MRDKGCPTSGPHIKTRPPLEAPTHPLTQTTCDTGPPPLTPLRSYPPPARTQFRSTTWGVGWDGERWKTKGVGVVGVEVDGGTVGRGRLGVRNGYGGYEKRRENVDVCWAFSVHKGESEVDFPAGRAKDLSGLGYCPPVGVGGVYRSPGVTSPTPSRNTLSKVTNGVSASTGWGNKRSCVCRSIGSGRYGTVRGPEPQRHVSKGTEGPGLAGVSFVLCQGDVSNIPGLLGPERVGTRTVDPTPVEGSAPSTRQRH